MLLKEDLKEELYFEAIIVLGEKVEDFATFIETLKKLNQKIYINMEKIKIIS